MAVNEPTATGDMSQQTKVVETGRPPLLGFPGMRFIGLMDLLLTECRASSYWFYFSPDPSSTYQPSPKAKKKFFRMKRWRI
jgi:hypothetical protein